MKEPLTWAGGIAPEVAAGNTGLIALAELAYDYDSGFLQPTKETRNAAAHRFIVLHDEGGEKRHSRSQVIDRHDHTDFEGEVVACLQIARAGLFYFRDLVRGYEKRKAPENPISLPRIILPSHDWVRGRE